MYDDPSQRALAAYQDDMARLERAEDRARQKERDIQQGMELFEDICRTREGALCDGSGCGPLATWALEDENRVLANDVRCRSDEGLAEAKAELAAVRCRQEEREQRFRRQIQQLEEEEAEREKLRRSMW